MKIEQNNEQSIKRGKNSKKALKNENCQLRALIVNLKAKIQDLENKHEITIQPINTKQSNDFKGVIGLHAELYISSNAKEKMLGHIMKNPKLECGGMLIGNIAQDAVTKKWIGKIDDVYFDDSIGTASEYTFKSVMISEAYKYCLQKYRVDWDDTKHIIGNYHSHGTFDAFFSSVDEKMMRQYKTNEFYIVYSPSYNRFIATFMDTNYQKHEVVIYETVENIIYNGARNASRKSKI